jgi:hypothetical protein
MKNIQEDNLYLKVLEFWVYHPKWFTYTELSTKVDLQNWEDTVIKRYLYNAVLNNHENNKVLHETIFLKINIDTIKGFLWITQVTILDTSEESRISETILSSHFILKYDAYFNYIDYLELQKAIKNSKEASSHARLAMYIAVGLWIIQIIVWIIQICLTK